MCIGGGGGGGIIGGFDPISMVASMVVGSLVSSIFSGNKQQGQAPQVQAPSAPPAPQAAKTPDQAVMRQGSGNGAASVGSAGSTLLTGGMGVSPSLLSLGKNTLLGA